jgi:hypothetical protein
MHVRDKPFKNFFVNVPEGLRTTLVSIGCRGVTFWALEVWLTGIE